MQLPAYCIPKSANFGWNNRVSAPSIRTIQRDRHVKRFKDTPLVCIQQNIQRFAAASVSTFKAGDVVLAVIAGESTMEQET